MIFGPRFAGVLAIASVDAINEALPVGKGFIFGDQASGQFTVTVKVCVSDAEIAGLPTAVTVKV